MAILMAKARVALFLTRATRILDDPARRDRHDPVEASPLDVEAIQRVAWELLAVTQELADLRRRVGPGVAEASAELAGPIAAARGT